MEIGVGPSMTSISFRRANSVAHIIMSGIACLSQQSFELSLLIVVVSIVVTGKLARFQPRRHNTNQTLSNMKTCVYEKLTKDVPQSQYYCTRRYGPSRKLGFVAYKKTIRNRHEPNYVSSASHTSCVKSRYWNNTKEKTLWVRDRLRAACHIQKSVMWKMCYVHNNSTCCFSCVHCILRTSNIHAARERTSKIEWEINKNKSARCLRFRISGWMCGLCGCDCLPWNDANES